MDIAENRILLVGGSPRKGGNSDHLLRVVAGGITEEGVPAEIIYLRNYQYSSCIGCEKCRKDKICTGLHDGMNLLYKKIIQAKGLVLVSPVHNYNVTAWMKAFIDRLYCFYDFETPRPGPWSSRLAMQGRKAVLIGVCEQQTKKDMGYVIEAMQLPLEALGYEIVDTLRAMSVFSRGAVVESEDTLKKAYQYGIRLARMMNPAEKQLRQRHNN